MIGINALIVDTGPVPDTSRRNQNLILREAYRRLGNKFHKENVPIRFTERAFYLLQYKRRSPKYERKKIKRMGHRKPLVYSGESERLAKIRNVKATATKKRAQAIVSLKARALNYKNRRSNIHMSTEVRRVSPREVPNLEKILVDGIERGYRNLNKIQRIQRM